MPSTGHTHGTQTCTQTKTHTYIKSQKRKQEEEKTRLKQEIARCEKMLSNPGFMNKAPQTKIDEEKAKLEKYKSMLEEGFGDVL